MFLKPVVNTGQPLCLKRQQSLSSSFHKLNCFPCLFDSVTLCTWISQEEIAQSSCNDLLGIVKMGTLILKNTRMPEHFAEVGSSYKTVTNWDVSANSCMLGVTAVSRNKTNVVAMQEFSEKSCILLEKYNLVLVEVCNLCMQSHLQGCSCLFRKPLLLFFPLQSRGVDVAVEYSASTGKVHIHGSDLADLI